MNIQFSLTHSKFYLYWYNLSIRTRMMIGFCFLFSIAIIFLLWGLLNGFPFTSYHGHIKDKKREVFQHLNLIADLKKERIIRWIEERRNDIHILSKYSIIEEELSELAPMFSQIKNAEYFREILIPKIRSDPKYQRIKNYFIEIQKTYDIYNRIIISDISTGITLFSTRESDIGRAAPLTSKQCRSRYDNNDLISNITIDTLRQRPMFLLCNKIGDSTQATVLIIEIDEIDIIRPMLHTGDGLGKNGEALLVNKDVKILTTLKHPLMDGKTAKPLEYQIKAKPAILAAQGKEGIVEALDYRGEPVLAAYRHIRLSKDLGWGLVVKQDRDELFAFIKKDILYSAVFGLIVIFTIIVTSMIMIRNFTRPIISLSKASKNIADGDLSSRANIISSDEIGQLILNFNHMADKIQNWQKELGDQVTLHTKELHHANELLKKEITIRKQVEAAVRASQQKYKTLLETANDAIFIADASTGYIMEINKNAEKLIGYSSQEIIKMRQKQLHSKEDEIHYQEIYKNAIERNKSIAQEFYVQHKAGHKIPVEISINTAEAGNKRIIQSIFRNITERKLVEEELNDHRKHLSSLVKKRTEELVQANNELQKEIKERKQAEKVIRENEERFRQFADNVGEVFWVTDLSQKQILYINNAYSKVFGQSVESLISNPASWLDITHPDDREKLKNQIINAAKGSNEEYRVIHPDGSIHWIRSRTFPINNDQGKVYRIAGIAADISEHKESAEKIKIHQQQLIQADKMASLGALVSGIAHEINNPNNFIMLNAPILRDGWNSICPILDDYYEENGDFVMGGMYYSEMRKNASLLFSGLLDGAKRIKRIVMDLKDFAREDIMEKKQTIDLNKVANSAVTLINNHIKKTTKNFSIQLYNDKLPVYGSFQKLEQVLINLIQNACDALTEQSQSVTLTSTICQKDNTALIIVKDEGIGIPKENINKITNPFFTSKREQGGTGLGLSVSSSIVKDHNGTLTFDSQLGKGTTVTFSLPHLKVVKEKESVESPLTTRY